MRSSWLVLSPLVGACITYQAPHRSVLSASGVLSVGADIESGDFAYGGRATDTFTIGVLSEGRGSTATKAEQREDGNGWATEIEDGALRISAWSEANRAGVHFAVDGPSEMDLGVEAPRGSVYLDSVEGSFVVSAGSIATDDVSGDVEFYASSGMDVEIWPYEAGSIFLRSGGGTVLALPYGLDYDLQVWGDAEYSMSITDLGFAQEYYGEGYYAASSGYATIQVVVEVTGGSFDLLEAY